jgi:hypothetical protein
MIILRTRRLGFNAVPTLPFTMFTVSLLVVPRMPRSSQFLWPDGRSPCSHFSRVFSAVIRGVRRGLSLGVLAHRHASGEALERASPSWSERHPRL